MSGKTALVTGGKSGIGWETALGKTIPQGAATSVWAATSTELDGKGGLYLQDCDIAPPAPPEVTGVKPYALDPAAAARLWEISERMVGEKFPLS